MAKSTPSPSESPAAAAPPVDGSTPITLTFDQLKELLGSSGGNTAAISAIAAQFGDGVIKADPNPPYRSALNPIGDRDRPRPPLMGTVFWLNTRLDATELTYEEIELLNALKPGVYGPYGAWVVEDRAPGMGRPEDRVIQITFPNKDADHRSGLPSSYKGMTGMVVMLREMVEQGSAVVLA